MKKFFPIQEACIPVLLTKRDVIGQAHTGSGKTAAFALAMLQQITPKKGIQGNGNCTNKGTCNADIWRNKEICQSILE